MVITAKTSDSEVSTTLSSSEYIIDTEMGVVKVSDDYASNFITVAYSYGFNGSTDVNNKVKQAILSVAPMIFRASQVTTDAGSAPASKAAWDLSQGLLGKFLRHPGFQYKSIGFTET